MKSSNWYKIATLLDEIRKFGPKSSLNLDDPENQKRIEWISQKLNIPINQVVKKLKEDNGLIGKWYERDYFTTEYGWSVPTQEAIEKIKKFVGQEKVVEIGSGSGMWAKLMKDAGISICATDIATSPQENKYISRKKLFTDVEDLNAIDAIQKYSGFNVLMMSWPPYDNPMATLSIKKFNGNKLIFIGESEGGCTADSEFFSILESGWGQVGEVYIPQWSGIHDSLTFWKKK